jgi:flagellar basal body-associated protein FliL
MEEKTTIVEKGKGISKVKEVVKRSRYWDIKLIGISLIVITTLFFLSVLTLVLIRFSQPVRDWVLDISEVSQGENVDKKIVVSQDEDIVINVVKQSQDSVVSIAVSQLTLTKENGWLIKVATLEQALLLIQTV